MHPLRHRDLDHRDLVHHLVRDLALLQWMVRLDDSFLQLMVFRNLCVVDIVNLHLEHQQDVVMMGVLQNLVALNLDEVQTFQDVERHFQNFPADVPVDVEVHPLSRMDYFLDEVGVGQRYPMNHPMHRDYFLDEVLA